LLKPGPKVFLKAFMNFPSLPGQIPRGAQVALAMSGGVDSTVAAYLLKRAGATVWGVHLLLGDNAAPPPHLSGLTAHLGISLKILDLRPQFSRLVVDYFVAEYRRGRTPNPCIRCNALIKFGALWEEARGWGATHLATGHYLRLMPLSDGCPGLFRGVDRGKDQSYFLCRLPRERLPYLLFPLGGLTKTQTRQIFQELRLPALPTQQESQDICFVPRGCYVEFLRERTGQGGIPGDLVDREGRVLGRHKGLEHYTVGQRRGLGLPGREPYYVLKLLPESNRVVIGPKAQLYSQGLRARDPNWLMDPPTREMRVTAIIRYRHPGVDAVLHPKSFGELEVFFSQPQAAITPGQAVAFYEGDRLLGGAWIEEGLP
jgi:tRNA-specific 2-thiouridylase